MLTRNYTSHTLLNVESGQGHPQIYRRVVAPLGHLGIHPKVLVVRPPPSLVAGGWPPNGVASHPLFSKHLPQLGCFLFTSANGYKYGSNMKGGIDTSKSTIQKRS